MEDLIDTQMTLLGVGCFSFVIMSSQSQVAIMGHDELNVIPQA